MDNYDKYIGKMLDNRYEILEKIGTGGMAVVYKARCHRLNRLVAVKILKEELAGDEEFRRRFRTESQAVAMLSHPNIVNVYDVSRSGNIEYIVMELIDGITLKQYINRKGVLNWKETLHFTTQIVKALSHAHSRGIIHRDIKPHNIMILKDGSVKVADFGIARLLSNQNTLTQEALGSVHYISPEQAKGGQVDARSDLYSVGVVMYEMLTSRLPFVGNSAVSVAIQHISAIPLMPREINPDIPVGLEEITMHAMEANLNKRYASADEMLRDLEEFRKNPGITFGYGAMAYGVTPPSDTSEALAKPASEGVTAMAAVKKRVLQPTPDLSKSEYKKSKKRASKTSILIGIFCVVAFLALIFVFMWNYFLKGMLDPDTTTVTVPQFVGKFVDEIEANPEYDNIYNFNITETYDDEYAAGQVIAQDPQEGRQLTLVDGGITVNLTVSQGPKPEILMPTVVNKDYREVDIELRNLGLNLDIKYESEYDDSITESYVISQIPEAGTPLTEGSTVYITYSLGPETKYTTVPQVTGLTMSEAILRLEARDLTYKVQYVDSDQPTDTVVFQDHEANEEVPVKTEIIIQVSNGSLIAKPPSGDDENNGGDNEGEGGGNSTGDNNDNGGDGSSGDNTRNNR